MKIWLGTTTARWNEYKKYYFAINSYLKELGCVLMYDWMNDADKFYKTNYKDRNITKIYKSVVDAIDKSDGVVIEYTVPNFSSSHQINYSLLRRKPTLVMRLKKDNPRFNDSYLEAVKSPNLTLSDYSLETYKSVLEDFVGISKIGQGYKRYNVVLDTKQKYYLDWASTHENKSRSEIVRDLVDEKSKIDTDYKKYTG